MFFRVWAHVRVVTTCNEKDKSLSSMKYNCWSELRPLARGISGVETH